MERRNIDRYIISDAQVFVRYTNGFESFVPLKDLSKSYARIETNENFKTDDILELEIIIPTKEKICVKGRVKTTYPPSQNAQDCAVIQFLPFGSAEVYNSAASYQQLDDLIKECQQKLDAINANP